MQVPSNYAALAGGQNAIDIVQSALLAAYQINPQTLPFTTAMLADEQVPSIPLAYNTLLPKDQVLLWALHKVLTFQHQIVPEQQQAPIQIGLPQALMQQGAIVEAESYIPQVDPSIAQNPQYVHMVNVTMQLIDLYCNTFNVNPPPTPEQVFAAMENCLKQNNIQLDIQINANITPPPVHQQTTLNNLPQLLQQLSMNTLTYQSAAVLTTIQTIQFLTQTDPESKLLCNKMVFTTCTSANSQTALAAVLPQSFALPIHIPLMMNLGKHLLPGLGNVVNQLMPQNPQAEVLKAHRFHAAMYCAFTHLLALTSLFLTPNMGAQLSHVARVKHIPPDHLPTLSSTFPWIWVAGQVILPEPVVQQTPVPNPMAISNAPSPVAQQPAAVVVHQQTVAQQPAQPQGYQGITAPPAMQQQALDKKKKKDKDITARESCCFLFDWIWD